MPITKRTLSAVGGVIFISFLLIGSRVYSLEQTSENTDPVANSVNLKSESANDSQAENKLPSTQTLKKTTLGVHAVKVSRALRKHLKLPKDVGLIVKHVVEGSAAAKSGLQPHDVLHKFENQLLINPEQIAALVNIFGPESKVHLTVIRNGKSIQIESTLQSNNVSAKVSGFDAFDYFHGHAGRSELQNCALCHALANSRDVHSKQGEFDNYKFFHGKPGNAKLEKCSTCHAKSVHSLKLPKY